MRWALLMLTGLVLLVGCEKPATKPAAAKQTMTDELRTVAGRIATDPTNWRINCNLLTQFTELKVALKWEGNREVNAFETSVHDLIDASMGWVTQLDETRRKAFTANVKGIAGRVEASITSSVGGRAEGRWDKVEQEAVEAVNRSEVNLTPAQADRFGLRYRQLMENYTRLLILLRDTPGSEPKPVITDLPKVDVPKSPVDIPKRPLDIPKPPPVDIPKPPPR